MRTFGVGILLVGLAVVASFGTTYAADKDNEEAVNKDLKKLEGNWRMVRQDHEGREDNGQSIMKNGVLFDGKDYKFLRDGRATGGKATISIDPTKDPKEIDLKITGGTASGHTQLGIYRFTEDDKLEICMSQPRGEGSDKRPAKFTTKPSVGSGSIMYVLERVKE
jgi:uncharacterized protein (TIGR03067 family)